MTTMTTTIVAYSATHRDRRRFSSRSLSSSRCALSPSSEVESIDVACVVRRSDSFGVIGWCVVAMYSMSVDVCRSLMILDNDDDKRSLSKKQTHIRLPHSVWQFFADVSLSRLRWKLFSHEIVKTLASVTVVAIVVAGAAVVVVVDFSLDSFVDNKIRAKRKRLQQITATQTTKNERSIATINSKHNNNNNNSLSLSL
jgi:hypothetical protein